jgi:hypothetical protein
MKRYLIFGLIGLVAVSAVFATKVLAAVSNTVTICHATDSHSNPYTTQSPNIQNDGSLSGGHLNHTGPVFPSNNWGDIIPPYNHGNFHYAGMNWTTAGQAIWNNGCHIPQPTPTPRPTVTPTPTVAPTPTPVPEVDQCINLPGFQSEVPANMVTNSDHMCSCASGYHQVDLLRDDAGIKEVETQPSFTCEADPNPTPTPEPQTFVDTTHGNPGAPQAPSCPGFWPVGPEVFSFVRNSPTSITIEWHKLDSFVSDYVVHYGPAADLLVWNKIVIGSEKTDLNDLPANQSIWVTVAETNSGCVGANGNVIDP